MSLVEPRIRIHGSLENQESGFKVLNLVPKCSQQVGPPVVELIVVPSVSRTAQMNDGTTLLYDVFVKVSNSCRTVTADLRDQFSQH